MSADEDHVLLARSQLADALLGPADVGEQRAGPHARRDAGEDLEQRLRGCGEHHRVAHFQGGLLERGGGIDRLFFQRLLARAGIDVDADDAHHRPRPAQRERERSADQPQSDDGNALRVRHVSLLQ